MLKLVTAVNLIQFIGLTLIAAGAYFSYILQVKTLLGLGIWGGCPIALGIVFLIAPRIDSRALLIIVISVVSLGIGCYLSEIYLTMTGYVEFRLGDRSGRVIQAAAEAAGRPYDPRDSVEFWRDLRKDDPIAEPTISICEVSDCDGKRPIIEIDGSHVLPLSGIANVLTVGGKESGTFRTYKADRHGFRNPDQVWDAASIEVALVGDSFTHGTSVHDNETIAGYLRSAIPELISLGQGHTGPLAVHARIQEFLPKMRPKKVFYLFFEGNDLTDLLREVGFEIFRRYRDDASYTQRLTSIKVAIDQNMSEIVLAKAEDVEREKARLGQNKIKGFIGLRGVRMILNIPGLNEIPRQPLERDWPSLTEDFSKVMSSSRDRVAAWNGEFTIVYLPAWNRGRDKPKHRDHLQKVHELVLSTAKTLEINVIDLVPRFMAAKQPERLSYMIRGGHFSPEGYYLVAQQIGRALNVKIDR